MRKVKISRIVVLFFFIIAMERVSAQNNQVIRINQDVRLKPISDNVWIHISDMELSEWGKVSANGMAVFTDNQLVIIDTPWSNHQFRLLIQWFNNHYDIEDIKVIVSHYHDDNLGGLTWAHQNGIESYSIKKTQEICEGKDLPIPKNILSNNFKFDYHDIPLEIHFLGEGHTVDSISVYLPNEKILFGGCSVKALSNSGLGNTADANMNEWPKTLQNMKSSFPEVQIVIPGHGVEGTISLIDHTISLFEKY